MDFNPSQHVFKSRRFQRVVREAIDFFGTTPVQPLPPPARFDGTGVYGLYYLGGHALYATIATSNKASCSKLIYVGKAVPKGWRIGRARSVEVGTLYQRLREHSRSVGQTPDLRTDDFKCRFVILSGIESDLISAVEAELIRRYKPLWNTVVDGFGNHDPGSGRYNQAKSEWDILHPGRPWAARLTGKSADPKTVISKVDKFIRTYRARKTTTAS